ncbi:MAG TPA: DUF4383 domain-containing protein [Thermodesulfobacteriota bacterium]
MAQRATEFTRTTPDRGRSTTVREEVRRGMEERPTTRRKVSPPKRTAAQIASLGMGIASLSLGALAFVGPLVTGNRDKVINLRKGKLFDVFAMNPLHAGIHIGLGLLGILAARSQKASRGYLAVSSAGHAALATTGILAGRKRSGIYEVMGMAMNTADNILHSAWCGAAALFAARPNLLQRAA